MPRSLQQDHRDMAGLMLPLLALFCLVQSGSALPAKIENDAKSPELRHTDPEVTMKAPELIQHFGYPAEIVSVTTEDGYVLDMHRIPHGKGEIPNGCRPVVFMQHGLEADSTNWITNMPDQSAGFMFADAGFDVWLGNVRGNPYGKAHTHLDPDHHSFWKFSWDEMTKDLEAQIDKVLEITGQKSLYYIGHSQGTLTMFSKLSVDPAFAPKACFFLQITIKKFFALAPVGTVKNIKGMIKFLADWFLPVLDIWYDVFGTGEFLPNNWFMDLIAKFFCNGGIGEDLCDDVMFIICGPESSQFNKTRTPVYVGHVPAGTSTQNIMHYAQMVKAGTVARFDYGSSKENQDHYGVSKPPSYDFATIKTDMYLYWSDEDWIADAHDVKNYLLTTLNPNYVKQSNHMSEYNHLDYIWGLNAAAEIYKPIMKILTEDLGGSVKCPKV